MRTSMSLGTAAVLALASVARAVPMCAINCFQNAVTDYPPLDCTEANMYLCFCKSTFLALTFKDCTYTDCESAADTVEAIEFGLDLCEQLGAPLDIPTGPPESWTASATTSTEPTSVDSVSAAPTRTRTPWPECVFTCVDKSLAGGEAYGCASDDYGCFCENEDLVTGYRDCAYSECKTPEEITRVINYGLYLCESANVTITVPTVPPTLVPSGTASTTSSAPTRTHTPWPDCVFTCVDQGLASGEAYGCAPDDYECFCRHEDLVTGYRDCAYAECKSPEEITRVINYGLYLCDSVNVTITVPTVPPTVVPTVVPTGTATSTSSAPTRTRTPWPECVFTCVDQGLAAGEPYGCTQDNPGCFCEHEDLVIGYRDCAYAECKSPVEITRVINYGLYLCEAANITITVPTVPPTAGPTGRSTAKPTATGEPKPTGSSDDEDCPTETEASNPGPTKAPCQTGNCPGESDDVDDEDESQTPCDTGNCPSAGSGSGSGGSSSGSGAGSGSGGGGGDEQVVVALANALTAAPGLVLAAGLAFAILV
ncbi:hypothetical protein jhhlp_006018 [Lomentospora prolificans]|uniref:CFEM domain-containing protein n=1 Tax=Lomentospora prolificans TaxID=41688 RepID=A0A2N3N4R7_9PEZI|nr:hypothetical protein jhhlp_006018 [Lomentospora prolificans]